MDNWNQIPEQEMEDSEFPVSPKQAGVIVFLSIVFVLLLGIVVRIASEFAFGAIDWNSPFLVLELFIVVPALLIVKKYDYSFKKAFRFYDISFGVLFWSFIIGVSLAIIGDQLDRIVQQWLPAPENLMQQMETIFQAANNLDFILMILIATIGAGFCEEMLFRGFFQQILERKFQIWIAIAIPAVLFGLIHFMPWWLLQIILLGIALGILAWRCNSIYPTILVHAINNLVAILYIRFRSPEMDAFYLSGELVNPTVVLISIAIFLFAGFRIWQSTEALHKKNFNR